MADRCNDLDGHISIHAPHARSDLACLLCAEIVKFQSTLLMRGATTSYWPTSRPVTISIHAPHARSDFLSVSAKRYTSRNFNPRSSCEERPAQGTRRAAHRDISIHAPHARSDGFTFLVLVGTFDISIHAPHARSDLVVRNPDQSYLISIHAPHARSDSQSRST